MSISKKNNRNGWHTNTALCCDIKTLLRSDKRMKAGKDYQGVLRRDEDCEDFRFEEHFTFVETLPRTSKHNPRVFEGEHITFTRRPDGTLHPNFRPMPQLGAKMSPEYYAFEVYRELRQALMGLIEER